MGASKSQLFTQGQNDLAAIAKALAHPARIAILDVLAGKKACICNDIVSELPLAQATVSQHLGELKKAGFIRGDIDGASVCYCMDTEALERARQIITAFLDRIERSGNCC